MSKKKSLCLALFVMLLWGTLYPMVKLGFRTYNVHTTADILLFAGLRFVICGAIICAFAAIKNRTSYVNARKSLLPIVMSGFFAIVLHYGFSYVGLEMTASSKTALIKQLGVLFYVCFSFLFIKEDKPTLQKIISALLGFCGIIALNVTKEGFSVSFGDILILCASFCTVFSNVISKKVFSRVSPITATGISQFFGGILLLVIGIGMGGEVHFSMDFSLLIMGYICTASIVSYCIWFSVVKSGELSRLFIIKFAEPAFTCLFGALILHEDIWKIQYLMAFVLICGGIWFSNIKLGRKT